MKIIERNVTVASGTQFGLCSLSMKFVPNKSLQRDFEVIIPIRKCKINAIIQGKNARLISVIGTI